MPDYTDHNDVITMLTAAQDADCDMRQQARESNWFIDKEDGQWDPSVISSMDNRPRFTFDMVSDVVDGIAGDIEESDFDIKIRPAGGEATIEKAKIYDGIIRNIENISNASDIYGSSARAMVACGMDGWRVTTGWAQSDSFDQDLQIEKIANYIDRVWFDIGSEKQDKSDARHAWQLQSIPTADYIEKWPEGSKSSVSDGRSETVYFDKAESINVGEFLYKKQVKTNLYLMSNGAVYTEENLSPVRKELESAGVAVEREREKMVDVVYSRMFDGGGWLEDEIKTVFEWIPIIPCIANFKISENKEIWHGAVLKKMDPQRVYNYAKSREIEEGALAPRGKYWGTREQFASHESSLETLNTNADPVQTYTHVDGMPAPFWQGGAQVNQGLQLTAAGAKQDIQTGSGQQDMGGGGMFQSEGAVKLLQGKADGVNIKYFKPIKIAVCHTARILMNAIPKVYDSKRQQRILNEDGSFEMITLNDQIRDDETGKLVDLNDLSQGVYDATCDVAPAYKNRQQETIDTFLKLASISPEVAQEGMDVLLGASDAPKMNILAERMRAKMVVNGSIPASQLTDDEKEQQAQQQAAAAQQPKEPTPEEKIGAAELAKAQADVADTQSKIEDRSIRRDIDIEIANAKIEDADDKNALTAQKLALEEQKNLMAMQQQQFDQQQQINAAILNELKANADNLATNTQTLNTLKEAMGVDTIVGPTTTEAYAQQAEIVTENQERL